jgi:hypothetical protein
MKEANLRDFSRNPDIFVDVNFKRARQTHAAAIHCWPMLAIVELPGPELRSELWLS